MNTIKYLALFTVIQTVALALAILGLPIVAVAAATGSWYYAEQPTRMVGHWRHKWMWLWDNEEDGIYGDQDGYGGRMWWNIFYWSALRNSVNNFRFCKYVSGKGRPLWRKTWGPRPGGWYVAAGWNASGYPVLSGGRNVNVY